MWVHVCVCVNADLLLVVLGSGGRHIVDVLGGGQVAGEIILVLFTLRCVIHVHLTNPGGHHHLREEQRDI